MLTPLILFVVALWLAPAMPEPPHYEPYMCYSGACA
jgi:hypothetical protein